MRTARLDYAVASRALAGERVSGDRFLVKPLGNGTLAAVVDGLGHGRDAAASADEAIRTLEGHSGEPVASLVARSQRATFSRPSGREAVPACHARPLDSPRLC